MSRFKIAGCFLFVTLLAATFLYALNISLDTPPASQPRLLLIGTDADADWTRTLAGAQDAARDLGIELHFLTPTNANSRAPQALTSLAQNFNPADYDGIALSIANPQSQTELISDLAARTKLVTVGADNFRSKQLCHIGCSQSSTGEMVARLVRGELPRPGKVALLSTKFSNAAAGASAAQRLAGFTEEWTAQNRADLAAACPIVEASVDPSHPDRASLELSATLADPELAYIVAFDAEVAESAVKALATLPEPRRVPIMALESSPAILDFVADGRVISAVFHDPYRDGYTAIERLNHYCHADAAALPVPGKGSFQVAAEVVRKNNLADVRRRIRS